MRLSGETPSIKGGSARKVIDWLDVHESVYELSSWLALFEHWQRDQEKLRKLYQKNKG